MLNGSKRYSSSSVSQNTNPRFSALNNKNKRYIKVKPTLIKG